MTLIGMLHHRKDPANVRKTYAFAAVAKAEGVGFFYFTPGKVNFSNRSIEGKVLEHGLWVDRIMPFPDVIYNAGDPNKLAKSLKVVQRLREMIPFTTNSIGNKWSVYERLKKGKDFSHYLIPSEKITSDTDKFFHYLSGFRSVVFKPFDGRKGKGIYFISIEKDKFLVTKDSDSSYYTKNELRSLIDERLSAETYIMQPYIKSINKSGQIYDFRLHAQKDGHGEWVITSIYPRIAPKGSIIPNINNGGYTNYLTPFLKQEFGEEATNIKGTLEHFSLSLAQHLDELQMQLYGEVIDEIGIDIGLDENLKIWIYEVNWLPGCPPTFYLEMDVVQNSIRYAKYLANSQDAIKAKIEAAKRKNKAKGEMPIIAITGSAGKTTTKAMLASILSNKWNTFESKDYWNTAQHTEIHASEIDKSHEAVVLEYGMSSPGTITKHCSIIKPNISIVTNVGLAHVGSFKSNIKGIAKAKSELIHGMDQEGLLIINKDNRNSRYLETKEFRGKIITIGIKSKADYKAYQIEYAENGMYFKMTLQGIEVKFFIPIFGEHHVYNALNAIAVADHLGLTPMQIQAGLLFNKPARRLTVYNRRHNITLIDDTVHSHPEGVRAAIDVLSNIGKNRKIAVIGEIRALGKLREAEYRKIGDYVYEKEIDLFITYGDQTEIMGNQAKLKGFPSNSVHHFDNKEEMHEFLKTVVEKEDTILVKGASRINMYETIQFLKKTFK
ncbi:YheC/YheD family protein [Jeotgalibacillus proteolyticus]|uniref:UDP-N-acetylmuramoyl-tripeptide--D-alanyl-D-alanine ligase n=1 Tax=Jeotgalibacillus proteolyticus TaxID=2082395 RepID=A0A2S5G7N1_9BACL|nr:YheC/YheD family protein [Jeotgalibacillus proteolyticus]PPA68953.1 UDP-N-acetylmuramoyl-tripeptide--D-alanyl-D-alanine ligase [Jeotgalibacillus proteolyticus]